MSSGIASKTEGGRGGGDNLWRHQKIDGCAGDGAAEGMSLLAGLGQAQPQKV